MDSIRLDWVLLDSAVEQVPHSIGLVPYSVVELVPHSIVGLVPYSIGLVPHSIVGQVPHSIVEQVLYSVPELVPDSTFESDPLRPLGDDLDRERYPRPYRPSPPQ